MSSSDYSGTCHPSMDGSRQIMTALFKLPLPTFSRAIRKGNLFSSVALHLKSDLEDWRDGSFSKVWSFQAWAPGLDSQNLPKNPRHDGTCLQSQHYGGRDKQIPGDQRSASLAMALKPVRNPVSKYHSRWCPEKPHPRLSSGLHTHTLTHAHAPHTCSYDIHINMHNTQHKNKVYMLYP